MQQDSPDFRLTEFERYYGGSYLEGIELHKV